MVCVVANHAINSNWGAICWPFKIAKAQPLV